MLIDAKASAHACQPRDDIAATISSRAKKFKRVGEGRYMFSCFLHQDNNPSGALTVKQDGTVLLHCFSCGANGLDICNALGIDPSSLFPPTDNPRYEKQQRHGFSAWQLLHALQPDLVRLLVIATMLQETGSLTEDDRAFLSGLVIRLNEGIGHMEGHR